MGTYHKADIDERRILCFVPALDRLLEAWFRQGGQLPNPEGGERQDVSALS